VEVDTYPAVAASEDAEETADLVAEPAMVVSLEGGTLQYSCR
jgi:hypothetical protein